MAGPELHLPPDPLLQVVIDAAGDSPVFCSAA